MNEIVIHADKSEVKSSIPDTLKEHGISVVVEKLGIGPILSKSLLMKYRTIAEILSASVDELKTVPKIGEKKASLIREISDREYRAEEK